MTDHTDLPLFAPGPATPGPLTRAKDAPTSVEAARKVRPTLNALRRRVLELMVQAGQHGYTDNELRHLAEFVGYGHSTVGKRRTELTQLGYLHAVGSRHGYTVWAIRPDLPTAGLDGHTPSTRETPSHD